jgi:hypothetical protein
VSRLSFNDRPIWSIALLASGDAMQQNSRDACSRHRQQCL